MKYRIIENKKGFEIIQDPDGDAIIKGTEKTIEKAKAKVLKLITGG